MRWIEAMRQGRYDAAWTINDLVLHSRNPRTRDNPKLPYHQRWVWNGRPPEGLHTLVRCYHGLGDSIQFARFLPVLAARAASVCVEVQPKLLGLFEASFRMTPNLTFVPFDVDAPRPSRQCDIEIMELCHVLRLPPDDMPSPYLLWQDQHPYSGQRFRIGLCWRSGGWDDRRSIPLSALAPALAGLNADILTLQDHDTQSDARTCESIRFINAGSVACDVEKVATLLAASDLVVTVDTMVAHLAGALGRPTWMLLQAEADWRWMDHRADSPWYPSARLYRQAAAGDWTSVLQRVRADLIGITTPGRDQPAVGE